jgi:histone-lysine N-methyltransferase SETMAR
MECQVDKNQHFRHLLLFAFNQGSKATNAAQSIRDLYGADSITDRTAQRWFARFQDGNFDLEDTPRSGRPSDFDEDALQILLYSDPRQTTRELAEEMGTTHTTIENHLHSMGKVRKLGAWVPHTLTINNKIQRSTISASLLARHRRTGGHPERFLHRIITGDEKWCLYINVKQRAEWLSPDKQATPRARPDLHPRKTMMSVWWDVEGVVHYELLPRNQTITADLYCQQLRRLNAAIQQKRPNRQGGVILQHDNARPHTANLTQAALEELHWEVLPHPPYSPDLAPSDYHLFRSMSNAMRGKTFADDADLRNWLDEFFASKPAEFYRRGIQKLPERWEEVVTNNGEYLID